MYERYTDRARKIMNLAECEAHRFNHQAVDTDDILLGLLKEGTGVAANVLKNLDVDLRNTRLEIEKLVQTAPDVPTGKLPLTSRAQRVIELAKEESIGLYHNYVGSEHLLVGLLREPNGLAVGVLTNLGLTPEKVREEVLKLLGRSLLGP